eukprot:2540856-Rhodomonas_salina.1
MRRWDSWVGSAGCGDGNGIERKGVHARKAREKDGERETEELTFSLFVCALAITPVQKLWRTSNVVDSVSADIKSRDHTSGDCEARLLKQLEA